MEVNDVVKAKIIHVTDYGFHMEAEGENILVLIPEISWHRIRHPSEYARKGDELDVLITLYQEHHKFIGSIKKLYPELNPWRNMESYQIGQVYKAVVKKNVDYGTFVSFDVGATGLLHKDKGGGDLPTGSEIILKIIEISYDLNIINFEFSEQHK